MVEERTFRSSWKETINRFTNKKDPRRTGMSRESQESRWTQGDCFPFHGLLFPFASILDRFPCISLPSFRSIRGGGQDTKFMGIAEGVPWNSINRYLRHSPTHGAGEKSGKSRSKGGEKRRTSQFKFTYDAITRPTFVTEFTGNEEYLARFRPYFFEQKLNAFSTIYLTAATSMRFSLTTNPSASVYVLPRLTCYFLFLTK